MAALSRGCKPRIVVIQKFCYDVTWRHTSPLHYVAKYSMFEFIVNDKGKSLVLIFIK